MRIRKIWFTPRQTSNYTRDYTYTRIEAVELHTLKYIYKQHTCFFPPKKHSCQTSQAGVEDDHKTCPFFRLVLFTSGVSYCNLNDLLTMHYKFQFADIKHVQYLRLNFP